MRLNNEPLFISVMIGIFLFLILLFTASVIYNSYHKNTRFFKDNPDEWLLHGFHKKIYSAFFRNQEADEIAVRLGLNMEEYHKNCRLLRILPDAEGLVSSYLYGIFFLLTGIIFGLYFNTLFMLIGLLLFYFFAQYKFQRIKHRADELKQQVKKELPQFLELLKTELAVGFPVDEAIRLLSMKYDSLLSKEFLESLNEVKLGVSGWQTALEKVAEKYELDILSDFVMDLTMAFNKGISVTQAVSVKAMDIKRKYYLDMKERAGRTENMILLPITLCQFIPMFLYILLPVFSMVQGL